MKTQHNACTLWTVVLYWESKNMLINMRKYTVVIFGKTKRTMKEFGSFYVFQENEKLDKASRFYFVGYALPAGGICAGIYLTPRLSESLWGFALS